MAEHDDVVEDKKLIAAEFKKRGLKGGGMAKYAKGGVTSMARASLGRNLAKIKNQKSGRGR